MSEKSMFLGVDLGGSNISAALMDAKGKPLAFHKIQTQAHEGPRAVIDRLIRISYDLVEQARRPFSDLKAIGIGVPGVIDCKTGVVRYSPNLPGWKSIPLRQALRRVLHKSIIMDNDANVAAYGEKWLGAGKGYSKVVVYTLGTGVGGGIILDNQIYHGACDGAGELGHMTVLPDGPVCSCGNRGCLEALVSGTAIARIGRERLKHDHRSVLNGLSEGHLENVTAKMIFQAARQGDPLAQSVVQQTGVYLGIAVANIINLINPELVIIGGGVSVAGEALIKIVRAEAKQRALKDLYGCVKIVRAKLSDRAGVLGAVGLAMHA